MAEARNPLVSIIVPCYNYGRYVGGCLRGILEQTVIKNKQVPVEIIVIDDCSTDETPEVLALFPDERIKVIRHKENRGLVFTLAEGLTLARGKYWARIDADDRYHPDFLEKMLQILERHPEVGIAYADVALVDEKGVIFNQHLTTAPFRHYGGKDFKGDQFVTHMLENFVPTPASIGLTEAWRKGLPFPEWFTYQSVSDWWLNLQVAKSYPLYYRAEILSDYRIHSGNMHSQPVNGESIESTIVGVFDQIFREPDRRVEKANVRRHVYAQTWLTVANVHFFQGRFADARRCYARCFLNKPAYLRWSGNFRHFLTTFLPHDFYQRIKKIWKALW